MEVIKNTGDLDLTQCVVYDAHLLKTFRACEEKYRLFDVEHVVRKSMKAAPAFGIAMHEGIAAYRMAKKDGLAFPAALEIGQQSLLKHYKKAMPPEMLSEIMADEKRGPKNALRLFTGYCNHYEPMAIKWLHVEVPFALSLGKVNVPIAEDQSSHGKFDMIKKDLIYVGIIDGVGEFQSRLDVNDIKTTGWAISQSWLDGWRLDQGLQGYVIAAREILGIDTHNATVHGIWVSGEAKNPKTAKPLDEYFQTKELYWDDDQMAEWDTNVINTVEDIELKKFNNKWVKDFGQNCGAFGGCDYRDICWTTPKFRSKIIEMEYERKIWTPLEDERLQKIEGIV